MLSHRLIEAIQELEKSLNLPEGTHVPVDVLTKSGTVKRIEKVSFSVVAGTIVLNVR